MFFLRYIGSELRRRKGRTVLTSLGLAVGVGLVVTVAALSQGLDDAQSEVLEPLTGVGTDMSVQRPISIEGSGDEERFSAGPGGGLSEKERRQLEKENSGGRVGLSNLGEPGERFESDEFMSTDLSFPEREVNRVEETEGVEQAAPALTLNAIHVSGKVPDSSEGEQRFGGPPVGGGGPDSINLEQSSVSGIDGSTPNLALVTPEQVIGGRYLRESDKRHALVSRSYAEENDYAVGDEVSIGGKDFKVVGIVAAPLGGEASDYYTPLAELQNLSDRKGRINVLRVRAESSDQVASVATSIESGFEGSEVTTAQDLAERVSGSLVDAQSLSDKLGTALAAVALIAAVLIASLLTLSSVNKRVRELGTLKALGWRQRLVVRQVAGESLAQGLLGGFAGAVVGVAGAAAVGALGISLEATVSGGEEPAFGPFGQGQVTEGSSAVELSAPVDPALVLLAIGLAVLGGLVAGAVGASRAARLRPAEALRSVE